MSLELEPLTAIQTDLITDSPKIDNQEWRVNPVIGKIPDNSEESRHKAVIFLQDDPRLDLIEGKVTFAFGKYLLCLSSNIPETITGIPIRISTGIKLPIPKHLVVRIAGEDPVPPDVNRKLLLLKSKLVYTSSENLDSTRLYWKLDDRINSERTYLEHDFVLCFDDFICSTNESEILQLFQTVSTSSDSGMLLVSTRGLNGLLGPQWYIRECFRDVWEFELKDTYTDLVCIEGPQTGEFYLFSTSKNGVENRVWDSDCIQSLIDDIRSRISGFGPLEKISKENSFQTYQKSTPRTTPEWSVGGSIYHSLGNRSNSGFVHSDLFYDFNQRTILDPDSLDVESNL